MDTGGIANQLADLGIGITKLICTTVAMLEGLAPPGEPRAWQVGDLLRFDGHDCKIAELPGGTQPLAKLQAIVGTWQSWVSLAHLDADAVRLKLVPVEGGNESNPDFQ